MRLLPHAPARRVAAPNDASPLFAIVTSANLSTRRPLSASRLQASQISPQKLLPAQELTPPPFDPQRPHTPRPRSGKQRPNSLRLLLLLSRPPELLPPFARLSRWPTSRSKTRPTRSLPIRRRLRRRYRPWTASRAPRPTAATTMRTSRSCRDNWSKNSPPPIRDSCFAEACLNHADLSPPPFFPLARQVHPTAGGIHQR